MVEKNIVVVLVIGSDIFIGVIVAVKGKTVVGAVEDGFEVLVDRNIVNDNDEITIDCVVDDIVVVYDDNMEVNIFVIGIKYLCLLYMVREIGCYCVYIINIYIWWMWYDSDWIGVGCEIYIYIYI